MAKVTFSSKWGRVKAQKKMIPAGKDIKSAQDFVHHKDGNHLNNPADGSNWENLCVYCHEDVHSRGVLADYLGGEASVREFSVVYKDVPAGGGSGLMAQKLKKALHKNKG